MTPVKAACFMLQRCGAEGFFLPAARKIGSINQPLCVCVSGDVSKASGSVTKSSCVCDGESAHAF